MALTFVNLQDRVIALGNYGESDRTNIKSMLNVAYYDVCKRRRWSWLESSTSLATVANTATVAVPAAVQAFAFGRLRPTVTDLWAPDYIEDFGDFDNLTRRAVNTTDTTSEPLYYSIFNNLVYFYPTPNAIITYSLYYWAEPVLLSADSDVPLIPDIHRDVIVFGALMHHSARDRDPNMYQFWQNQYEGQLEELRRRDLTRTYQSQSKAKMPQAYGRIYDRRQ